MKYAYLFIASALIFACGAPADNSNTNETPADTTAAAPETPEAPAMAHFGDEITPDGAIAPSEINAQLADADSVPMKVSARVDAVCQKKGCWMTVKLDDENDMMVRFKDYGFFVPLDCDGKTAVFEGVAFRDTTSVADLQHYAEDAGKTQEEIDAITEPEISTGFLANGVIITDGE